MARRAARTENALVMVELGLDLTPHWHWLRLAVSTIGIPVTSQLVTVSRSGKARQAYLIRLRSDAIHFSHFSAHGLLIENQNPRLPSFASSSASAILIRCVSPHPRSSILAASCEWTPKHPLSDFSFVNTRPESSLALALGHLIALRLMND